MREALECDLTRVKDWPEPMEFNKLGAFFRVSVFTTLSLVVLFGAVRSCSERLRSQGFYPFVSLEAIRSRRVMRYELGGTGSDVIYHRRALENKYR